MNDTDRRAFLKTSLSTGGAFLLGMAGPSALAERLIESRLSGLQEAGVIKPPRGELLGLAPFVLEGTNPLDEPYNEGLGGRLATDLTKIDPENPTIPNEHFFIRTRCPDRIDLSQPWKVRIGGLVKKRIDLSLNDLNPLVRPMGTYVMECSGNNRTARNFGLLSAAKWSGVPVAEVLKKVEILPKATRVLISGFDGHSKSYPGSIPGASWVLSFDQLESYGAFLATKMNGKKLPLDHGFPVRLIIPRWYGCTCAKWVNEIVLTDDSQPATSQMLEFAQRTHQDGQPRMAKDYKDAAMDTAAMPMRVERRRVDGRIIHRVVGIIWGGSKPTNKLSIRFGKGQRPVPVAHCPMPTDINTWSLWSTEWKPTGPGRYDITLTVDDSAIRTRRLDRGYYLRTVEIKEV